MSKVNRCKNCGEACPHCEETPFGVDCEERNRELAAAREERDGLILQVRDVKKALMNELNACREQNARLKMELIDKDIQRCEGNARYCGLLADLQAALVEAHGLFEWDLSHDGFDSKTASGVRERFEWCRRRDAWLSAAAEMTGDGK